MEKTPPPHTSHKHKFTRQDDSHLTYLVKKLGTTRWNEIAAEMGISTRQARERYKNCLDPGISHSHWTKDEDDLILSMVNQFGHKWATISDKLPGRTDVHVKNRYFSLINQQIRGKHSCHKNHQYQPPTNTVQLPPINPIIMANPFNPAASAIHISPVPLFPNPVVNPNVVYMTPFTPFVIKSPLPTSTTELSNPPIFPPELSESLAPAIEQPAPSPSITEPSGQIPPTIPVRDQPTIPVRDQPTIPVLDQPPLAVPLLDPSTNLSTTTIPPVYVNNNLILFPPNCCYYSAPLKK